MLSSYIVIYCDVYWTKENLLRKERKKIRVHHYHAIVKQVFVFLCNSGVIKFATVAFLQQK